MGYDRLLTPESAWKGVPSFIRFAMIGGINTLFGYGAYAFLLWLGLHYAAAALFATVTGIAFNFFTTSHFVFDSAHEAGRVLPFLAAYAVIYAINVASIATLNRFGIGPYVAGLILILPMAVASFVLMRRFVFRTSNVRH